MEDHREPLLFDQDHWSSDEEFIATAPEWAAMRIDFRILPWIDGLYNRPSPSEA